MFIKKILIAAIPAAFLLIPLRVSAQISLTAENMALGGGGTAYLTGYETLFVNPANLYIREKNYSLQIALLQGGGYFDSQRSINNPYRRFRRYAETFTPYEDSKANRYIDAQDRPDIISRNYRNNRQASEMQSQADIYWAGLKWATPGRSYALALRTRISSRFETGRGYFSDEPLKTDQGYRINQSFTHQYQALHELSFGYAESFTFLNGLVPQLSEFIIGVAPKIIVAGAHLNSEYTNRYHYPETGLGGTRQQEYFQQSTGYFSETTDAFYRATGQPETPLGDYSTADLLKPAGIGLGLDIGVTYLITFGSDLSVLRRQDMPTEKSLRFSFSVTDLGAVYQYQDPLTYETGYSEQDAANAAPLSDMIYAGAPNEHLHFLAQHGEEHPLKSADSRRTDSFDTVLPTSLQAGLLFQVRRIKLMGDFSYAISNSAFGGNRFTSYFGAELRPFSFLPLRAGTRLTTNLPGYYSFGGGLETKYFDLNAAVQLRSRSIGPTSEIAGASVVGLKFYIP